MYKVKFLVEIVFLEFASPHDHLRYTNMDKEQIG
jgi:hypothetical protein